EYRTHKEEHELGTEELDEYLNCELCYPIVNELIVFKKFWDALFKFEDAIIVYNNVTINGVLDLLSMNNSEREDTIHKGKCRDIMDRITESIRYRIQPKMKEKGLQTIILVIVRDCIEGNLENEVFDRLIGNPELIEHKYILEDWDVERKFEKFWQWYKIISKEVEPLRNFNTSLYLRFERFRYWWNDKYEDSMTFKDSEDIDVRDSIILKIDDGVIEWIVTELKEAMERTQKFKLIEIEQEEDNEIYDSEEEIEIIVKDKTWKLSEIRTGLRQLIVNPKEKLVREIMKFGIKEKIETGILLTSDFIRYYIFQEGRFDKSEDIKEWMDLSTKICNRCNKQKLDYMISEENGRCEECNQEIREEEQDELIELKNNLEKLGYAIDNS
ncbi:hypothetical protein RhiirB3_456807, partial [Rhizophagus irregularis]